MVWKDKGIEQRTSKLRHEETSLFIPQRTQPPHRGHISMLEAACSMVDEVIIGIGSANIINKSNPYYSVEREMMLRKSLDDKGLSNYRFIHMPDFNEDRDWIHYILDNAQLRAGTKIVSGNEWVQNVFGEFGYQTLKPEEIIKKPLIDISATTLRSMIVEENPEWENYAASGTLHYFERFGGKQRITRFYENE